MGVISGLSPNFKSLLFSKNLSHRTPSLQKISWAVSLPVHGSATTLWTKLQESISKNSFDTPLYRFNIPNLRVGTLDSLLSLSDDLLKSNNFVEGVSHKIRRQIEELERVSGVDSSSLTVDGVPVDSYLTRFSWDEAKYPTCVLESASFVLEFVLSRRPSPRSLSAQCTARFEFLGKAIFRFQYKVMT